jgi:hypothetical protein
MSVDAGLCPKPLPLTSEVDRAKKSLDECILLSSIHGIDAATERILAELVVVREDDDGKALWIVAMVHNIEDIDVNSRESLQNHISKRTK